LRLSRKVRQGSFAGGSTGQGYRGGWGHRHVSHFQEEGGTAWIRGATPEGVRVCPLKARPARVAEERGANVQGTCLMSHLQLRRNGME